MKNLEFIIVLWLAVYIHGAFFLIITSYMAPSSPLAGNWLNIDSELSSPSLKSGITTTPETVGEWIGDSKYVNIK